MENTKFAKLANYSNGKNSDNNRKDRLCSVLDSLGELLKVDFGSITIKFHEGKWNPKIEIERRIVEEVKK
jgi:hypothetical protein